MRPEEIVDAWFPEAVGALVAGSVARGEDTPTSDLDLLILLSGPPAPMRRTERVDGQLVEFFVHTEESYVGFVDREARQRRSPLLHMYRLTAVLDDLADERDPACLASLATAAFIDVADLALAIRRRWSGHGRWLGRRLAEADEVLAHELAAGLRAALDGDATGLARCGRAELDRAGGPLDEGYARYA